MAEKKKSQEKKTVSKTVKAQSSKKSVTSKNKSADKTKKNKSTEHERLLTAEGWKRRRLKEGK